MISTFGLSQLGSFNPKVSPQTSDKQSNVGVKSHEITANEATSNFPQLNTMEIKTLITRYKFGLITFAVYWFFLVSVYLLSIEIYGRGNENIVVWIFAVALIPYFQIVGGPHSANFVMAILFLSLYGLIPSSIAHFICRRRRKKQSKSDL